jgi:hypothetical protein
MQGIAIVKMMILTGHGGNGFMSVDKSQRLYVQAGEDQNVDMAPAITIGVNVTHSLNIKFFQSPF